MVHEVMLFFPDSTVPDAPPLPEYAEVLSQRMQALREAGVSAVGIDASAFGICAELFFTEHSELEYLDPDLQTMQGRDGTADTLGRPCPSDPGFAAYQRGRFRTLAGTRPDFVYLEDELRLAYHAGKAMFCFCPHCLARFDEGRWTSREDLVASLDRGEDDALRGRWIRFVESRLVEVVRHARAGIDEIDPEIDLGLMPVNADHSTYNGRFLPAALAVARSRRVRPGHGWYADSDTGGLLRKLTGVARCNSLFDTAAVEAQYEFESWPGGQLAKGHQATRHEVTGAIAAGCRGFALNDGPWRGFVDEVMRDRMEDMQRWRPAWDRFMAACRQAPLRGLYVPAEPDMMARARPSDAGWFAAGGKVDAGHFRAEEWQAHGFPLCVDEASACAVLLPHECAECATDEQLQRWLRGGLICDGGAAAVIAERGFGDLLGVEPLPYQTKTWERFTANPITAPGDVGQVRWHIAADSRPLRIHGAGVEELGDLCAMDGTRLGASLARFENSEGGRIVVAGYHPWSLVGMPAHWRRLDALVHWVARGRVPLRLDRCRRVAAFLRMSDDGAHLAMALLNTGFDATGPLRMTLPSARTRGIFLLGPDGERSEVARTPAGDGTELLLEQGIGPWGHAMLVTIPIPADGKT
ncbi:MAG: hypothetical protein ACLFVC_07920 [Opitutales bacterium]